MDPRRRAGPTSSSSSATTTRRTAISRLRITQATCGRPNFDRLARRRHALLIAARSVPIPSAPPAGPSMSHRQVQPPQRRQRTNSERLRRLAVRPCPSFSARRRLPDARLDRQVASEKRPHRLRITGTCLRGAGGLTTTQSSSSRPRASPSRSRRIHARTSSPTDATRVAGPTRAIRGSPVLPDAAPQGPAPCKWDPAPRSLSTLFRDKVTIPEPADPV